MWGRAEWFWKISGNFQTPTLTASPPLKIFGPPISTIFFKKKGHFGKTHYPRKICVDVGQKFASSFVENLPYRSQKKFASPFAEKMLRLRFKSRVTAREEFALTSTRWRLFWSISISHPKIYFILKFLEHAYLILPFHCMVLNLNTSRVDQFKILHTFVSPVNTTKRVSSVAQ